jgi:hypothetical protein
MTSLGSSNLLSLPNVDDVIPGETSITVDGPPRSPFDANPETYNSDSLGKAVCIVPSPLAVKDSVVVISSMDTESTFDNLPVRDASSVRKLDALVALISNSPEADSPSDRESGTV